MRRSIVIAGVLVAALAAPPGVVPAAAHPSTNCLSSAHYQDEACFYLGPYYVDSVTFSFTGSVPASSVFRDRIEDGRTNWPISGTNRPIVGFDSTSLNWPYAGCENYANGANGIHYNNLFDDPEIYAETCLDVDVYQTAFFVSNSQIAFNNQVVWWPYDSAPPSSHVDLESVATHEFGHALGQFGHFSFLDGTTLCGTTSQATMCPTFAPGHDHWRSTTTHDRHTMLDAYT